MLLNAMNILELTIFYLACGAPFAVYSFFQPKIRSNIHKRSVLSFLVMLFWIPFAIRLSINFVTKKLRKLRIGANRPPIRNFQEKLTSFEMLIAQILYREKIEFSVFEFREVFGRYVGLTLEVCDDSTFETGEIDDLYRVAQHPNFHLASICLNRRNRLRLEQHQRQARNELLHLFSVLYSATVEKGEYLSLIGEFAEFIADSEMTAGISQMSKTFRQTSDVFVVNPKETKEWNALSPQTQSPNMNLNLPIS